MSEDFKYTGYEELDLEKIKRNFSAEEWKLRYSLLITSSEQATLYAEAKPLESLTFLTYRLNNDLVTVLLKGNENIDVERTFYDEYSKEYIKTVRIKCMIGNIKNSDLLLLNNKTYPIVNIDTMMKKEWSEIL